MTATRRRKGKPLWEQILSARWSDRKRQTTTRRRSQKRAAQATWRSKHPGKGLKRSCSRCGASAGQRCKTASGKPTQAHKARSQR